MQEASDEHYDAEADDDEVRTEVTTLDGKTYKHTLPPPSTVLALKQHLARNAGLKPQQTRLFVDDGSREEELEEEERLGSLRRGKGLAVMITVMVEEADAQEVVPRLAAEADLVLGDDTRGHGTYQLHEPRGVAFVPAQPDWIVTAEFCGHRVKISNIRTGTVICKFGERGSEEGQFYNPWGVAVTSDSSFIIVVDKNNHSLQVLRLLMAADSRNAHLEFVRHIGNWQEPGRMAITTMPGWPPSNYQHGKDNPIDLALLPGEGGGQETVLVSDTYSNRVLQFKLDGTFIRIFAGTGSEGSDGGGFDCPQGIAVLGVLEEVAVAVADSRNHSVHIFDREGNYKRQFGNEGEGRGGERSANGQLYFPSALASDAHGNLLVLDRTTRLQVFSPEGAHLCTRNDLGLQASSMKGIAWSDDGELAIADDRMNHVLIWHNDKGLKTKGWGGFVYARVSAAARNVKQEHCQKGVVCVLLAVVAVLLMLMPPASTGVSCAAPAGGTPEGA
jgi:DNA-binding beta-propeller fold protein YncE